MHTSKSNEVVLYFTEQILPKICSKYYSVLATLKMLYEFLIVSGRPGSFLAVLKISAILLKYTFEGFHGQKCTKPEFLHKIAAALKS